MFYGAAEFSRDCDVVVLASDQNLSRLHDALRDLQAERIAIPEFRAEYLQRGHAVHFRCHDPDVRNLRLDVMSRLRGCDDFDQLWQRRTTIEDPDAGFTYELLSIQDLVRAKKTKRDKDWPMIRRLIEAHYDQFQDSSDPEMVRFWLRELRTPELLSRIAKRHPERLAEIADTRPWLQSVDLNDMQVLQDLLLEEQSRERQLDAAYWQPLQEELAQIRKARLK
ncbi:MAG: hypothetical protein J5I93_10890 [Pirellulaceae bacterium]|nr:hypothetical protein [Pirellulaceae bacterium]